MAGTEMMDNIILLAFPDEGYSFVSQTYAGRVNANSAMNSNGFSWTMTAILSDEPVWGLTEVYFHYLAQIAASPAEAVEYLQNTPGVVSPAASSCAMHRKFKSLKHMPMSTANEQRPIKISWSRPIIW